MCVCVCVCVCIRVYIYIYMCVCVRGGIAYSLVRFFDDNAWKRSPILSSGSSLAQVNLNEGYTNLAHLSGQVSVKWSQANGA